MNSNQFENSNSKFEKTTADTNNKRFDHHLIDQDLELEDKNGRRINPNAQVLDSKQVPADLDRDSRPSE